MKRTQPILIALALGFLPLSLAAADLAKPRIEVFKAKRELQLFDGEKLIKTYRIALGTNPKPPKEREGDRATPEGSYFICRKKSEEPVSPFVGHQLSRSSRRGARFQGRADFREGAQGDY